MTHKAYICGELATGL